MFFKVWEQLLKNSRRILGGVESIRAGRRQRVDLKSPTLTWPSPNGTQPIAKCTTITAGPYLLRSKQLAVTNQPNPCAR
jgi:hypothetical protein